MSRQTAGSPPPPRARRSGPEAWPAARGPLHAGDAGRRGEPGAARAEFDRAGRTIPGISDHQARLRLGYDHVGGPLGGHVERVVLGGFYRDSADLPKAPGHALVDANLDCGRAIGAVPADGTPRRIDLYGEIRNVFDAA